MTDADEIIRRAVAELQEAGSEVDPAVVDRMVRKLLVFNEVGLPALEADAEHQDRKIKVWEVLVPHMAAGCSTWSEVWAALDDADRSRLTEICDGDSFEEVALLLDLGNRGDAPR